MPKEKKGFLVAAAKNAAANPHLFSQTYEKQFVTAKIKRGVAPKGASFKTVPRKYYDIPRNPFREQMDTGLYHPVQFSATEMNPIRDWTFARGQTKRRSMYFEGVPEIYLQPA